jgi:signal transduction histidine kinase
MELEYTPRQFRFLVRDNGRGIDPDVLKSGRDGHWGLPGMRERAERIGGQLHVWSSATAGTEVVLSVPAHIAYADYKSNGLPRWMKHLYTRTSQATPPETKAGGQR